MGGCLATIFKGQRNKHPYRPIRTGTTAKYGTNSQGRGYGGKHQTRSNRPTNSSSSSSTSSGSSSSTLTCPACGYSTQYKREMHQHIQARHGGKVKRPKAVPNPAEEYVPGGSAGESAAGSQWSDLHKSESELAAEIILREHNAGRYNGPSVKKPSRFARAKKGTGNLFRAARSAIATHGPTKGTRGVDNGTRKKKKKKKKRAKE